MVPWPFFRIYHFWYHKNRFGRFGIIEQTEADTINYIYCKKMNATIFKSSIVKSYPVFYNTALLYII